MSASSRPVASSSRAADTCVAAKIAIGSAKNVNIKPRKSCGRSRLETPSLVEHAVQLRLIAHEDRDVLGEQSEDEGERADADRPRRDHRTLQLHGEARRCRAGARSPVGRARSLTACRSRSRAEPEWRTSRPRTRTWPRGAAGRVRDPCPRTAAGSRPSPAASPIGASPASCCRRRPLVRETIAPSAAPPTAIAWRRSG